MNYLGVHFQSIQSFTIVGFILLMLFGCPVVIGGLKGTIRQLFHI